MKLIELLQGMGVKVRRLEHGTFAFQASDIDFSYFETEDFYNKAVSLRGSIMILGPLGTVVGGLWFRRDSQARGRQDWAASVGYAFPGV